MYSYVRLEYVSLMLSYCMHAPTMYMQQLYHLKCSKLNSYPSRDVVHGSRAGVNIALSTQLESTDDRECAD